MPQALPLQTLVSENSRVSTSQRSIISRFGDGYSQRAADGLNSKIQEWSISWTAVTASNRDIITAALDAVGSWDYLTWQSPIDVAVKRYIMTPEGYSIDFFGDRYIISCNIMQVFDL